MVLILCVSVHCRLAEIAFGEVLYWLHGQHLALTVKDTIKQEVDD